MPRFSASLRANIMAPTISFACSARRLFLIIVVNDGTPIPNKIASTVMPTISSMMLKPRLRRVFMGVQDAEAFEASQMGPIKGGQGQMGGRAMT
jgi:hypothetical protein